MMKSLPTPTQTLAQLLGQGVVAPSSIVTEKEKLLILGAILQGLIEQVMSQDLIWLAVHRASFICDQMGIDPQTFLKTANEFIQVSNKARTKNPMHSMF